jgi:NTP pyrophosphatase (non-canonical NTP hydrolase)
MNIDEIKKAINEIAMEKGWYAPNSKKPQTPINLAISISLEVAELMECFQWSEFADKSNVGEELADIVIFVSQLSNIMNIDLSKEISKKLMINKNRSWE